MRRSLGLDNCTVVGFIGSFYAYEGLDLLLEAMRAIFANGEYRRIMEKWGVGAVSVQAPQMNLVGNR